MGNGMVHDGWQFYVDGSWLPRCHCITLHVSKASSHINSYTVVFIKLTIKIDITDYGILALLRVCYGFVLEHVEIKFGMVI